VPPIRNKEFPEWIEKLWIDAEDSLMKADEVNFIGYSFPETDTMAINMFKRACRGKLIRIILPVAYLESDHSRLSEILDNPQMIPMKFSTWCLYWI